VSSTAFFLFVLLVSKYLEIETYTTFIDPGGY
jgi:hypothetical protein